jgi:5-hydroxyisourate hydrolase-like protein (transthyretin family)
VNVSDYAKVGSRDWVVVQFESRMRSEVVKTMDGRMSEECVTEEPECVRFGNWRIVKDVKQFFESKAFFEEFSIGGVSDDVMEGDVDGPSSRERIVLAKFDRFKVVTIFDVTTDSDGKLGLKTWITRFATVGQDTLTAMDDEVRDDLADTGQVFGCFFVVPENTAAGRTEDGTLWEFEERRHGRPCELELTKSRRTLTFEERDLILLAKNLPNLEDVGDSTRFGICRTEFAVSIDARDRYYESGRLDQRNCLFVHRYDYDWI